MDKNTKIKDLETLLQESRIEEEIQSILEELEANDAPEAIEDGEPTEIEGDASREEYMPDEEEADDVEEVVVESSMEEAVNISTGDITLGGGRNKSFTRGDTAKTNNKSTTKTADVDNDLKAEVKPSVSAEVNPTVTADVDANVDADDAAVSVGAGKANSNLQKKSRNESVEYAFLTEAKKSGTKKEPDKKAEPKTKKEWDEMDENEKKTTNKKRYEAEVKVKEEEEAKRKAKEYARGKEAIELQNAKKATSARTGAGVAEIAGGAGTMAGSIANAVNAKTAASIVGGAAGGLGGLALIGKGIYDLKKAKEANKKRKALEKDAAKTYIEGDRDYTDEDVQKVKKAAGVKTSTKSTKNKSGTNETIEESMLSDYELMQVLDECGYIPSMENVQILREMDFLTELTEEELALFTEEELNALNEGIFGTARGALASRAMGRSVEAEAKKNLVAAKQEQAKNQAAKKIDALKNKASTLKDDDARKDKLNKKAEKLQQKSDRRQEKDNLKQQELADKQKVMQAKAGLIAARGVGKSVGHQKSMNAVIKGRNDASKITGDNLKQIKDHGVGNVANASTIWTDYELMQLLDECGYVGSLENLLILKEDESLLLELCEEVLDKNPEHEEAEDEGFKDGEAENEAMPKHEHKFENGVCEICGKKEDDESLDEAFNNIFNILSEELDVNDAPKAIDSTESDEISAEFDEDDYLPNEEEADDVEEVVVESLSDYELMQLLDEAGYEPTIENAQILREHVASITNYILNEATKGKKKDTDEKKKELTAKEKKKIVDEENKKRRTKAAHVAQAIAKGAVAAGLIGGAGWMAVKHGAAEAANIKNLGNAAEATTKSIEAAKTANAGLEKIAADTGVDAQAANKAVADAAANSATVDSSLVKAADSANAAHATATRNLQQSNDALKAAEDKLKDLNKNISKTKRKALIKQAAKVGVTGAGAGVAIGSAISSGKKAKNLKEAFDFGYRYYENSANKEVLVEQVALTIASENKDRLFVEMVNATILANKLRNELLEKYSDTSLERVNTILEELAANETPDAIKANGYSEEVADFEREDFMNDEEEADDVKEIVIETYISTEDVKDMLKEYGFEANESNVNFLKEELAMNDSPVAIKIKDADEIKANFVRVDYFPEEIMSDDINGEVDAEHFKGNPDFARKDYMVDEVEVEDVKEIVVESIKRYAKDTIEKIIKTNC